MGLAGDRRRDPDSRGDLHLARHRGRRGRDGGGRDGGLAIRARIGSTFGPLALYALLSLAFFGRPLANGDRELVGTGTDPSFFVWALGWWPHAILDGDNPFVTHAMWPVVGINMAWVGGVPGLAIPAAPLTLAAGPVIAYNAVAVALPALAAWTAFLLCRYVTGSWWASLAGGYLFGFSSYMLGHTMAHPGLTAVFLVPLVALTLLHYLDEKIAGRGLALRLGLLLGLEPYLSTEVFATLTIAVVASLLVAYALVPEVRGRLRSGVLPLLGAFGVACVVAAPILGYAFADFHTSSINDPARFPADLLNIVVPTDATLVTTESARELSRDFLANITENGAYLGLPLLLILGWFAWQRRRDPRGRFLVVLLALGIVAELGVALRVAGERVLPLPWALAAELPALNNILPGRFSMYVALGAAVATALWAAAPRPSTWVRVALVSATVVSLLPAVTRDHLWRSTPPRPEFFSEDLYERCLLPDETVLIPDAARMAASLWQAESGYRFRLANGYVSSELPEDIPDREVAFAVFYNAVPEGGGNAVVRLARGLGATVIMLDDERLEKWGPVLVDAGLEPIERGGVWLYHLRPVLPSCR